MTNLVVLCTWEDGRMMTLKVYSKMSECTAILSLQGNILSQYVGTGSTSLSIAAAWQTEGYSPQNVYK